MEDNRPRVIVNKVLILILLSLIVSNIFFYTRFKELRDNSNYISNFSSALSIAALDNDMSFLYSHLSHNDLNNLEEKFKSIKPKIGNQYSIKQYIAIEYKNGNTLMIKTTQDNKGKSLIEDMFILDEYSYKRVKDDSIYGQ